MELGRNRFMHWSAVIILGLIVFSFIYVGTFDTVFRSFKREYLATIDDAPINEDEFLKVYREKIRAIRNISPSITSEQLKAIRFPERILSEYVNTEVLLAYLKAQNFAISDNYIKEILKKDAVNIANYLKVMQVNKKSFIEDIKKRALISQIFISYALPAEYKKLLFEAFHIRRNFDLITITNDKIIVKEKPTDQELSRTQKDNQVYLKAPENRSFKVLIFEPKVILVKSNEVETYYKQNSSLFRIPEKRDVTVIQVDNREIAQNIARVLPNSLNRFKNDKRVKIQRVKKIVLENLPQNVGKQVFSLRKGGHTDIVETGGMFFIYIVTQVHPSYIPALKQVKNLVSEVLQNDKNKKNIQAIKDLIEKEDISLEQIAKKYNYRIVFYQKVERSGIDQNNKVIPLYSKTLMNEVFHLDKNETSSDIVNDYKTKTSFMVQVIDIQPEKALEGAQLKEKLYQLWLKKTQQEKGQKYIEQLLHLEKDEKAFYAFVKNNNLNIKRNLTVSRSQPLQNMPSDFMNRILSANLNCVVFAHIEGGSVVGRVTSDQTFIFDAERFKKEENQFTRMGLESLDYAFMNHILSKHKVKLYPELLNKNLP